MLKQTRIHLLGARGIEGIITVPATGAASLNWLLYDGHGNMVRTMNTTFALSAYQWRGVWGERTNSTPSRGYCANLGHPEDETGLVYMRAWYYEPTTGRLVSEDPARDGVNWYLYADGDPVNRVDADGESPKSDLLKWVIFDLLFGKILPFIPKNFPYLKVISALISNTLDAIVGIKGALLLGAMRDIKVAAAAADVLTLTSLALLYVASAQLIMLGELIMMDLTDQEASDRWKKIDQYGGFCIAPGWGLND